MNPCGVCGGPDQRHRMVDAQMERVVAGEDIETVAEDYGKSVPELVKFWADCYSDAYEGWFDKQEAEGA